LGYRWEANERELELIRSYKMYGEIAIQPHKQGIRITFADILGPEYIPEVNCSQSELLNMEIRVRQAAISWSRFFETIQDA